MRGESSGRASPLVMCLTNTVAANFTANVLLAIGAKPAMVEEPSEAAELAAAADAVLVNVGTLTPFQAEVMREAVRACRAGSVPWVLDPVACQALAYRRAFVEELLAEGPTAVRGNRAEIDFLLSGRVAREDTRRTGFRCAPASGAPEPILSLSTGEVDLIRRGDEIVERITGGVAMLQQVTATGCAQGAVVAAFLGRGQAPVDALRSASRLMKRAGERAWEKAKTPGSFQIALLDALAEVVA